MNNEPKVKNEISDEELLAEKEEFYAYRGKVAEDFAAFQKKYPDLPESIFEWSRFYPTLATPENLRRFQDTFSNPATRPNFDSLYLKHWQLLFTVDKEKEDSLNAELDEILKHLSGNIEADKAFEEVSDELLMGRWHAENIEEYLNSHFSLPRL